jgi:hypothetical protein
VVRKQIIVDAAIDRAFTVFTERFGDFKPPEHNLLRAPIAETVFEPHVGGTSSTASAHSLRLCAIIRAHRAVRTLRLIGAVVLLVWGSGRSEPLVIAQTTGSGEVD